MQERIHSYCTLQLILIALVALPLLGYQAPQISPKKSVFIVATRDSRLLTMCPTTEAVSLPNGRTWKANGKAAIRYISDDWEYFQFPSSYMFPIDLPLPVDGSEKSALADQSVSGRAELDRITLDPEVGSRIEKEFRKRKEFILVDSLAKADLVFLAESTYSALQMDKSAGRIGMYLSGDHKAEFRQSVLAIVVPAAGFNPGIVQSAALMKSRLWEGSVITLGSPVAIAAASGSSSVTMPPIRGPSQDLKRHLEDFSASPEAVVAQFHNKQKRPPDHFPLCAASAIPLKIAGMATKNRSEIPTLKNDPNGVPVLPAVDPSPAGENQSIRADVVLVTVPVTVSDQNGKQISDLTYSDFRLFEDGIEQKIDRSIPEAGPVDVALMLDTSKSMSLKAEEMQTSALAFAAAVRPADRIMAVSFDDRIWAQSDIRQLRAPITPKQIGKGTRLYDAIHLVLEDRLDGIKGRKAIVLFTDGVDTQSRIAAAADTLASIEESNVLVYAIQYETSRENDANQTVQFLRNYTKNYSWVVLPEDVRNNSERYARADKYLFNLCNGSGGELYLVSKGINLAEVFGRIADQLSHQFTLAYYPTNPKQDGSFHRLRVEVNRPGAKVRSRIGYRAPGQPSVNR